MKQKVYGLLATRGADLVLVRPGYWIELLHCCINNSIPFANHNSDKKGKKYIKIHETGRFNKTCGREVSRRFSSRIKRARFTEVVPLSWSDFSSSKMHLALCVLAFFAAYAAMAEKVEESPANSLYPYYGPNIVNQRNLPTATTTTTSTSTSIVTCTVKINGQAGCTGRRRRGIQFDEDSEEQFIVSPSKVQG